MNNKQLEMLLERFDNVENRFDKLEAKVDKLEAKVDKNHAETMQRFKNVDMTLINIQTDVEVIRDRVGLERSKETGRISQPNV